ncbi:MAG TPA: hypothetical protein VIV12_29635, partial [Streptosporangiaceae bacterium]
RADLRVEAFGPRGLGAEALAAIEAASPGAPYAGHARHQARPGTRHARRVGGTGYPAPYGWRDPAQA